jgi:hypothetical protein
VPDYDDELVPEKWGFDGEVSLGGEGCHEIMLVLAAVAAAAAATVASGSGGSSSSSGSGSGVGSSSISSSGCLRQCIITNTSHNRVPSKLGFQGGR